MKTKTILCALLSSCLFSLGINAQTLADFEFTNLAPPVVYWDGSDQSGGFSSGNAFFPNVYETQFGGYWASGFAYSIDTDTVNGFPNLYSSANGTGHNSPGYGVAQQDAVLKLTGNALGGLVNGVYLNNSAYARVSMRDGDTFAKKFGGLSGDDPDYFKLCIRKYLNGTLSNDSVEFYLADYRFVDNSLDYIVTTWTYVDLTPLGNCDSILFTMRSTDVSFGFINTPLFFCLDDLETNDGPLSVAYKTQLNTFSVYPNPSKESVVLKNAENSLVEIYDFSGRMVMSEFIHQSEQMINIQHLPNGIYTLNRISDGKIQSQRLLKQ
jgi:hypothetical protein